MRRLIVATRHGESKDDGDHDGTRDRAAAHAQHAPDECGGEEREAERGHQQPELVAEAFALKNPDGRIVHACFDVTEFFGAF